MTIQNRAVPSTFPGSGYLILIGINLPKPPWKNPITPDSNAVSAPPYASPIGPSIRTLTPYFVTNSKQHIHLLRPQGNHSRIDSQPILRIANTHTKMPQIPANTNCPDGDESHHLCYATSANTPAPSELKSVKLHAPSLGAPGQAPLGALRESSCTCMGMQHLPAQKSGSSTPSWATMERLGWVKIGPQQDRQPLDCRVCVLCIPLRRHVVVRFAVS